MWCFCTHCTVGCVCFPIFRSDVAGDCPPLDEARELVGGLGMSQHQYKMQWRSAWLEGVGGWEGKGSRRGWGTRGDR